jgi:hypothetical protein
MFVKARDATQKYFQKSPSAKENNQKYLKILRISRLLGIKTGINVMTRR